MINKPVMVFSLIFLVFWLAMASAGNVTKLRQVRAAGGILDIAINKGQVAVATDKGVIEVYRQKTLKKRATIYFKDIFDFYGDPIRPKVFSVDIIGKKYPKILSVIECTEGGRRLVLSSLSGKKKTLVEATSGLQMRKARFINAATALIALMSSELILFDIVKEKALYRVQITQSIFSDFQLGPAHKKVAFSSESGDVQIVEVANGKVIQTLSGGNRDNVFKVDYKNGFVLTGGQDRKAVLYREKNGRFQSFKSDFFVYAVALENHADKFAYLAGEQAQINIINVDSGKILARIPAQNCSVNNLRFVGDSRLLVFDESGYIQEWDIR